MADKDFLGVGMKFPPQVNPATGRFVTVSYENSVKESIYLILMTRTSERLVRPRFGANIENYVFMDVNLTSLNMMRSELTSAILNQEPRIRDIDINIEPQLNVGRLILNIGYYIIETNSYENLVFPYYLDRGTETEVTDDTIIDIDQEDNDDEESSYSAD